MASILTLIVDGLAWIWSLISLIFGTIFTFLRIFIDIIINQLLFGLAGRILIGSLILVALGYVMTETHVTAFEAFDEFYCDIVDLRRLLADVLDALADTIEIFICFYNVVASLFTQFLFSFFDITFNCGDRAFLATFEAFGLALAASAEATIGWALNPLNNSYPFFSPLSPQESAVIPFIAPDMDDVWHPIVDILDSTRPLFECLCEDSFINDVYNFFIDRLTSPFLGCTIDRTINSALNATQETMNAIIELTQPNFEGPNYKSAFTMFCEALICAGDYIDEWVFSILDLFLEPAFDLKIGCIISRALCVIVEFISVLLDILIQGLVTGDLSDVIANADLNQVLLRGYELADCVEALFALIDVCLGQFFGGIVRLFPVFLQFLIQLFQMGEFAIEPVIGNFTALLGDTRFDHVGETHIGLEGECFPNCNHEALPGRLFEQTGLTCFISKVLGNSECAMAFADLVNAVAQVYLIPILLVDEILVTDFSVLDFNGNPLAGENRDEFDDLVLDIVCVITDRFLLLPDYLGHLLECIEGLEGLGDALVQLTEALNFVIDDLKSLLLLIFEVLAQAVIWIFTLFGADPFGDGTAGELLTFFELFFDLFIELFEIILQIVKGLIDFVLFPWFPGIFGQGTLLSGNPGTARFTQCFEDFGDCICGISKSLADNICLPLGVGCLSALWPDCGDFEPARKRQLFFNETIPMYDDEGRLVHNGTVFEYWADQFGDSVCGEVFERWRDGVDVDMSIGDSDGMEFLNCISMMHSSVKAGSNLSDVDGDFFVNLDKLNATGHHVAKGFGVMATTETLNLMLYYSDPATVLDRPEANVTYLQLSETLAAYGINDTVAINTVLGIQESLTNISSGVWDALNRSNPGDASLAGQTMNLLSGTGSLLKRGVAVGVMALQEMRNLDVFSKTKNGIQQATLSAIDTAQRHTLGKRGVQEEEAKQRRQVAEELERPITVSHYNVEYTAKNTEILASLMANRFPYPVSQRSIQRYQMKRFFRAMWEYVNHLTGAETLSPKYDARGEAMLEDHKPNTCTTVFVGCPEDIGIDGTNNFSALNVPPCQSEELFMNFQICNDLFDLGQHAVVTNCAENFQALDFYDSLAACQDIEDNPVDPDFSIRVAFNITKCFETTAADWICMNGLGCTACPVEEVIPGFECSLLDEVVHRWGYLVRRCIDKFGLGPPLPQIPTNVTEWFFDWLDIRNQSLILSGQCGNFVINNDTYCIVNPITRVEFCFDGEACDPPNWDIINGVVPPGQFFCGAGCQFVECGNGLLELPQEQCDDGNNNNGDGCDAYCRLEVCGNGRLDFGGICSGAASSGFEGENCNILEVPTWLEWEAEVLNPEFPVIQAECGTCMQANSSDPLDGQPCIWRDYNVTLTTEPAGCICVQLGTCVTMNISSPIFGQACFAGVDGSNNSAVNSCPFDGVEFPECSTPGIEMTCGDETLNCGLDPNLRCIRKEECDDGNRIPNDGCDRNCMLEQCPKIRYLELWEAETDSPVQTNPALDNRFCDDVLEDGIELDGLLPEWCFALPPAGEAQLTPTKSVELNCKAGDPVVWSYDNAICDGMQRPFETQILRNCSINDPNITGQSVICVDAIFDPDVNECTNAVQVGLEFTCTENCVVCGDNITGLGEQCDDGTILITGNETEDSCVLCQLACICDQNPLVPCSGLCAGGLVSGQDCDPRSDVSQCDNAPCVAFQCCGDLIQTGTEECDTNPEPANPDNSTCLFCITSPDFCECQTDKFCEGLCWENGEIVNVFSEISNNFEFVPCDMRLEPFACPSEGQFCMPYSCCGDGIINLQGNIPQGDLGSLMGECNDPDGCGNNYCEPGVSEECNATGIEATCGYNIDSDPDNFAEFVFDGIGLEEGRKDQCECQPGKPCLGKCYSAAGLSLATPDGERFLCDRTGAVYNNRSGYDASNQGDADCEGYGITNGICGAVACCGDGIRQVLEGVDDDDGPCEVEGFGGCTDPNCNYDDRWLFYEECSCVPGKPCLGRCSFFGDFTPKLCDPRNSSATPWCPHDTDPAYGCWAHGCCNDSINQTSHGVNAILGGGIFLTELNPLESCDNQFCGDADSRNDCGLGGNVFPSIYAECECDANTSIPCIGYCVDGETGLSPMTPDTCDPRSVDPMECPDNGDVCIAQQCCGDEIQQWEETCDNQGGFTGLLRNTTCNVSGSAIPIEGDADVCQVQGSNSFIVNCTSVVGPLNPWTLEWYNDTTCTSLLETVSDVSGANLVDVAGNCVVILSCNAPCDDCGLMARRRSIVPDNGWRRVRERIPIKIGDMSSVWYGEEYDVPDVKVRRQAELVDYNQHDLHTQGDTETSPLTQFFLDILDAIFSAFGFDTTGQALDDLEAFFTSTDIDILLPPEERGLLWYVVFPFLCRMPENTSCDGGIGLFKGFFIVLGYSILLLVIVQLAFGSFSSWMIWLFGVLFFSAWMGVGLFYAFPGCAFSMLPRLPECIGHEFADFFVANNASCFEYWPDGVVLAPPTQFCPGSCERTIADCKAIGFRDGLDTLMYILNVYFPGVVDVLDGDSELDPTDPSTASNWFFGLLIWLWNALASITVLIFQMIWEVLISTEFFAEKVERFDYGDNPVPELDTWCWQVTFLNIGQVIFLLLFAGLIGFGLLAALFLTIDRFWIFCARGEKFITDLTESDDNDALLVY